MAHKKDSLSSTRVTTVPLPHTPIHFHINYTFAYTIKQQKNSFWCLQTLNKAKPTLEGSAIVRHTGSILKGTANRELYKYFENGMKELEVVLDKSEKFLKVGCFGRKLGKVKISSIGIKAFEKYNIKIADFFASDGFVRGHVFHGYRVKSFSAFRCNYCLLKLSLQIRL